MYLIIILEKFQQEFEDCLSASQTAVESMGFQQSQEEFEEKIIQMFSVLSKTHKDLITNSQKTVESTIEKLNQEIGRSFGGDCFVMNNSRTKEYFE